MGRALYGFLRFAARGGPRITSDSLEVRPLVFFRLGLAQSYKNVRTCERKPNGLTKPPRTANRKNPQGALTHSNEPARLRHHY